MRALALTGLCCALALGCTPSFESQSDVHDLRILAVRAEPPDALVDLDQQTVEQVRVSVLAVDPAARDLLVVQSSVCFPTDSLRCGAQSLLLPDVTTQIGRDVLFPITVPAALLAGALGNDKLKGLNGIRLQLSLSADDADPNGKAYAAKTLVYSRARPGYVPNHTPEMTGLALTRSGTPAGTVSPGTSIRLTLGETIGLRPVLAPGAIEEYDTTDLTGNLVHLREQLSYAFYTTRGAEFDHDTGDEPLPSQAEPPDGLTRIDLYANVLRGSFWVVVRDGRGGESWMAFDWSSQ